MKAVTKEPRPRRVLNEAPEIFGCRRRARAFASPALADCQARLSQIEKVIGTAGTGATPQAQAAQTTKGTTAEGATGTVAGGQPSGVDAATGTQAGAAPSGSTATQGADTGSSKMDTTTGSTSGAATTGTGSTGAIAGGQASGVDASPGTQGGAEPSGSSTSTSTAATPSTGSIDMTSARIHLDAARTALKSGNEADCMKAADEAAKAAGRGAVTRTEPLLPVLTLRGRCPLERDVCAGNPPMQPLELPPHRFSVAPMMECTDRHCRAFHRILTREALLYTEMVTAAAVVHGNVGRLIGTRPSSRSRCSLAAARRTSWPKPPDRR